MYIFKNIEAKFKGQGHDQRSTKWSDERNQAHIRGTSGFDY